MQLETLAEERAELVVEATLAKRNNAPPIVDPDVLLCLLRDIDRLLAERAASPPIPESAMEELYHTGSAMLHTHVPGEAWRAPDQVPLPAEVEKMHDILLRLAEWEYLVEGGNPKDLLEAAALLSRWPKEAGWQPIETAPKDGTIVWLRWGGKAIISTFSGFGPVGGTWLPLGRDAIPITHKPDGWFHVPLPPAPKEGE